jgi:phosphoribosylglycinamide formyltransferase-1
MVSLAHCQRTEEPSVSARLVVLVSGTGTNLQALLDASVDRPHYGARVVGVGADREGTPAIERAKAAGVETFVLPPSAAGDRPAWDEMLTAKVSSLSADLVVLAGFMRLAGPAFLAEFAGRCLNTHPSLLPSFPGMRGPQDALDYGVKVAGATLFMVDAGVDTGPIVAQTAVRVLDDDTATSLHERIKAVERQMLVDSVGRMVREGFTIKGRKVTIP